MNLVSNSLKFTQRGSIKISISQFQKFNTHRQMLRFKVSDTGVGISAEDQKNLFKLFGTVEKHRGTLNQKGTGLGLTITNKLVTLLGGEIRLASKEQMGTKIEFTVKQSDSVPEGKPHSITSSF